MCKFGNLLRTEVLEAVDPTSKGVSGPPQKMQRSAEGAREGVGRAYQQLMRPYAAGKVSKYSIKTQRK